MLLLGTTGLIPLSSTGGENDVEFLSQRTAAFASLGACDVLLDPPSAECTDAQPQEEALETPWEVSLDVQVESILAKASSYASAEPWDVTVRSTADAELDAGSARAFTSAFVNGGFYPNTNRIFVRWTIEGAGMLGDAGFDYTIASGVKLNDVNGTIRLWARDPTGEGGSSSIIPVEPTDFHVLEVQGNVVAEMPFGGGVPYSFYRARIDSLRRCPSGPGAEPYVQLHDITLPPGIGYRLELWMHCGQRPDQWGYRVKRFRDGYPDGWIAGCFYSPAGNEPRVDQRTGAYEWRNIDRTTGVVDIYAYYPSTDTVEKRRTTQPELEAELEAAALEEREPEFPLIGSWTPPPGDPEVLGGPDALALGSSQPEGMTVATPEWFELTGRNGRRWLYSLRRGEEALLTFVAPGDRIELNGLGGAGAVEDPASLASSGAWRPVADAVGVVFEATDYAVLSAPLSGFVIVGGDSVAESSYALVGTWLGGLGTVAGPGLEALFADGFETGDLSRWTIASGE